MVPNAALVLLLMVNTDRPTTRPADDGIAEGDVYVAGTGGYHTYRIPSLIITAQGAMLAFCEGRRNSASDTGDIDLCLRRSDDLGRTWGPMEVIADHGPDTIGNPCPVVDRTTGTIWLLLTGNPGHMTEPQIEISSPGGTRTVWLSRSDDDGRSWTRPAEITAAVKAKGWTWYATGPGCGIQTASGRLVIPCDHSILGRSVRRSHVIYSDDHGITWRLGGIIEPDVNECQVVELVDGTLLMDLRNYSKAPATVHRRAFATSADAGLTWSKPRYEPILVEPVCQASLIRLTRRPEHSRNRLAFANPASTKREKMTIRLSYDEGRSWPVARLLYAGPSAYSALAALPGGEIGCLYERGEKHPYERMRFARCSLEWLTEGNDRTERRP